MLVSVKMRGGVNTCVAGCAPRSRHTVAGSGTRAAGSGAAAARAERQRLAERAERSAAEQSQASRAAQARARAHPAAPSRDPLGLRPLRLAARTRPHQTVAPPGARSQLSAAACARASGDSRVLAVQIALAAQEAVPSSWGPTLYRQYSWCAGKALARPLAGCTDKQLTC